MSIEINPQLQARLEKEHVIWLTTIGARGGPHPTPVWFLWDGETFLIYSVPDTWKLRNIAQNPRVALNLNSDIEGGEVAIFTGEARVDPSTPPAIQLPSYLEKYRQGIAEIEMTPESFSSSYLVPIRVRPEKFRGW